MDLRYERDEVDSDDLAEIIEITKQMDKGKANGIASSSKTAPVEVFQHKDAHIQTRLAQIDAEVRSCREDIARIQEHINRCLDEKKQLETRLSTRQSTKGKGKAADASLINYSEADFEWLPAMRRQMKAVFGIKDFRLCQKGACNANMDRRDIVCIMPTGGGKSLTYQLPALITAGCTLVISPLISLMTDQIMHLHDAGIEAEMITSATPKPEKARILQNLKSLSQQNLGPQDHEIKLVYVTPEKVSKDASFRSLLQRLDQAGKLARIVIDEAHCVSQLGHDFRPDYKELHVLRKILPSVPIMALSATCGPQVLADLIKILGMKPPVDGNRATPTGTAYFSSPLYRKNLHYKVVPKPDKTIEQIVVMKDYILEYHANDTGIIYCFSIKDTQTVAEKLREISNGKIKTGVYNSQIGDREKQQLHLDWRGGKIKVVCATIAFGLGIDKGDVRFVLHHSISKSLEGLYQESGRAGRDGNDSDCILYYRPQDASSLGGLTAAEKEGSKKLHAVLQFAEDLTKCRKVQFAEYFSHSSQLSISSWSTDEVGALDRCGHCDNCVRSDDSIERKDVTLYTWQLLKVVDAVRSYGGKLTLGMLATLARGGNKGAFEVSQKRKKQTTTEKLDLDAVAGGPVDLSKSDLEHLIVHILTQQYLQEEYHQTAYTCNVYLSPGPLAARFKLVTRDSIVSGSSPVKVDFTFSKKAAKVRAKKAKTGDDQARPKKRTSTGKAKKGKTVVHSDVDDLSLSEKDDMYDSDSEPENADWEVFTSTKAKEPQAKRPKRVDSAVTTRSSGSDRGMHIDNDVIELSSD